MAPLFLIQILLPIKKKKKNIWDMYTIRYQHDDKSMLENLWYDMVDILINI